MTSAAERVAKVALMMASISCARRIAPGVAGKSLFTRKLRPTQNELAEGDPFPFVLKPKEHGVSIAGSKQAVWIDRRVTGAGSRRRCRTVKRVVERI